MFKTLHILAVLLLCSSFSAHAEWSKQYDLAYTMGDGDTKGSARQSAIEQIKLKASNEAGTYVDSTTTLKEDGSLTESIQMISASMVKVRIDKETMSISQSGQTVLNLVATATLDDTELTKRVEILRQDKEKAQQMKVLQAENEVLRAGLDKIRASLANKSDPAMVAELLAKQDQTIRKLEANNATVTQVFSQGTLLQLAMKDKDVFAEAKQYLDDELYAPILKTKVDAKVESVEQKGDNYVAVIRVGWEFDLGKSFKVMDKHLSSPRYGYNPKKKEGSNFMFNRYDNEIGNGRSNLSIRLFDYIAERPVFAKISIAGEELRLPVLYGSTDTWNKCGNSIMPSSSFGNKNAAQLCVAKQNWTSTSILGVGQTNPIRISLTKEQAESATNVTAVMMLYDKETSDKEYARRIKEYELERESASRAEMKRRAIELENYRKQRVYLDKRAIRSGMGIPSNAY